MSKDAERRNQLMAGGYTLAWFPFDGKESVIGNAMQGNIFLQKFALLLPPKDFVVIFGPIPWLISSKIAPGSLQNHAALFCGWKKNVWLLFSGRKHGSKSFSLTTLVECLFLLHWDGNFIENWQQCSLGAVNNGIRSFFAKGKQNPSLFVGEIPVLTCDYPLVLFAFLHLLAGNSNLNFLSPGKTQGKFSLFAQRGCWCGPTPGELPSKGKIISKLPYARRIQGQFGSFSCSSVCIFN